MENSFLSVFSTSDLHNKVGEIKHKWEHFMVDPAKNETLEHEIRPEILQSWRRCQSNGLNPEQKQARLALTSLQLEEILSESILYRTAKTMIDHIFDKLIGTGYLITLNDETGKMIYLKGEPEIMKKLEKMNFTAGMDWSEDAAGTNAIGTSIVSKKPIQVFSAEHFCEGFHPMTCSSSPIFHPYTRKVIGAIDFTGLWPSTQPHTLGLAVSLAHMIEQELLTIFRKKYNQLEEYYHRWTLKYRDDPILVFSDEYVLVNGDEKLVNALKARKRMTFENLNRMKKLLQNDTVDYQFHKMQPIIIDHQEIGYAALFKTKNHPSLKTASHGLIGTSPKMTSILHKCEQIASIDTPVLVTGETGTGKEVIAKYIHERSPRKEKPFIAINCGAISKELISSELFGYESGTFTGAKKDGKKGKFEEANGGTIFLDEIGEMPLDLQVHLLRVLQEKEVTRLGSSKTIKIDVKVIAATNKDLEEMIKEGSFREDLFFRLNVISFSLPALRERKEDILPLCDYYLTEFAQKYQKPLPQRLSEETKYFILNYEWPGNIRELRNAMEHAVIFNHSAEIEKSHLPDYFSKQLLLEEEPSGFSIREKAEMEQIRSLLIQKNGNISAVSKELNMARSTLYRKLKKYRLKEQRL